MTSRWPLLTAALVALAPVLAPLPLRAEDGAGQGGELSVEDQIQILAEEVARLREEMAIPETDEQLTPAYGMGPAASKVYGVRQGISLGGYGEFYFASPLEDTEATGAVSTADLYRFITYFGYKFNDWIVMNTEIEFEHATTSPNHEGEAGSVSVEFSYLDFLIANEFNLRGGNLLVPMGFLNEMHEPPFYKGNFRPEVERRIIPSTWRELGAGAHGNVDRVRYTAYVLNGLNAAKFGEKGIRDGRQKANRALTESLGGVIALHYEGDGARVATSFYAGGADQNALVDSTGVAVDVSNWIWEAHAGFRHGGFEARGLFAVSHIEGAKDLTGILYPDGDKLVPEDQLGWYLEAAFDVAPFVLGSSTAWQLSPWVRYEDYDLQSTVPDIPGAAANAKLAVQSITVGLDAKPHPNVVLKLDYVHVANRAEAPTSDEIRLGAGFVF